MTANTELNVSVDKCVLGLVFIIAFSALITGGMIWLKQGFTEDVMVLITCGGITSFFIFAGMVLSKMTSSRGLSPPDNPQPHDDPPPTYRNTWRLEYIDKSPFHLKMELQKPRAERYAPRRDVRSVWTSTEVRVHGDMSMDEYVYNTSEIPAGGHSSSTLFLSEGRHSNMFGSPLETGSSERPERTNTLPLDFLNVQPSSLQGSSRGSISTIPSGATATGHHTFDEGLPSYEDVHGQ